MFEKRIDKIAENLRADVEKSKAKGKWGKRNYRREKMYQELGLDICREVSKDLLLFFSGFPFLVMGVIWMNFFGKSEELTIYFIIVFVVMGYALSGREAIRWFKHRKLKSAQPA